MKLLRKEVAMISRRRREFGSTLVVNVEEEENCCKKEGFFRGEKWGLCEEGRLGRSGRDDNFFRPQVLRLRESWLTR